MEAFIMSENHTIRLADVPTGGPAGSIWNRLHGDREEICEALIKQVEPGSEVDEQRTLLQARLRTIDDALDRLMSGSYGICSKCGRTIEAATLDIDPAWPLCLDCWPGEPRTSAARENKRSNSDFKVVLQNLTSFDTVLVRTANSVYRILLLDPKTGRALVEGGSYLLEPSEALVRGSAVPGTAFEGGTVGVGARLEIWVGEKVFLTSPIVSVEVNHNLPAESVESISDALH